MKIRIRITAWSFLALAFLLVSSLGDEPASKPFKTIVGGRINGQIYSFKLTSEEMIPCPSWDESEETPPLSPRKALKLAKAFILRFQNGKNWPCQSIALEQLKMEPLAQNRWYYVVTFEVLFGVTEGLPVYFRVPVLMNEKILEPDIKKITE